MWYVRWNDSVWLVAEEKVTQFVSTGPKSYSFKYGFNKQKSAIKGFTLIVKK